MRPAARRRGAVCWARENLHMAELHVGTVASSASWSPINQLPDADATRAKRAAQTARSIRKDHKRIVDHTTRSSASKICRDE